MLNRFLITACIMALFLILAINILPLFWGQQPNVYIHPDEVSGMAVSHDNRLFTLNHAQQKKALELLNRSIPVGKLNDESNKPVGFDRVVIYRFNENPIEITPLGLAEDNSLFFDAPVWSSTHLKDVSEGDLEKLLSDSYDRQSYN